jgi:hypothetical protein
VAGEDSSVLGGELEIARAPGDTVGTYALTPSGLTSGNYDITYEAGELTIEAAALTITADDKTKQYGSDDPVLTVSYSGFVAGEDSSVLGGELEIARAPGDTVGTYALTPSGLTSGNYDITYEAGELTIEAAALTITADDKTKQYGSDDPVLTVIYSGFVAGEDSSVLGGELVIARAPGDTVGTYALTPSGLTSGNYDITYEAGELTIEAAALTITADDKTKQYGSDDPVLTVSYSGFVAGEDSSVLGGELEIARAPGDTVGTYALTPSGLTSGNYDITYEAGELTIEAAALTITADDKTKQYGSDDPVLTVSYSGLWR